MQLSDARAVLSGWLQDTTNVQWSVIQKNRYINLGLRETEKHILGVDPEAFKCTYRAATTIPTTGTDNLYSYPAGTFAVVEIAISSDGSAYLPLQRLALKNIRDARENGWDLTGFVPYDAKHFILWPSASTVVALGIRVIVAPTLVMADDTDSCPLPLAFESMMLKEAQKFALWDVGEPTEKVQAEIDQMKTETPRFYLTATEPAFVSPRVTRYSD